MGCYLQFHLLKPKIRGDEYQWIELLRVLHAIFLYCLLIHSQLILLVYGLFFPFRLGELHLKFKSRRRTVSIIFQIYSTALTPQRFCHTYHKQGFPHSRVHIQKDLAISLHRNHYLLDISKQLDRHQNLHMFSPCS